ncbi:MAG TPA: M28 family peptidase [Gemmatimonadaceae bacterium]|nr:M28 family peptidase [Gemmatimonadaceae bacterium]
MRRLLPIAVILAASCARPSGRATPSSPITAAELKHRVEIIADDSMGGRLPGSRGNIEATDYIAAEFKRMGLQPAGDSGGYLQYVPMISSRLDTTEHLTVNGAPLAFGTGVIAQNPTNLPLTLDATGVTVVYGGRLGTDAKALISPDSGAGEIVVFAVALFPDGRPDPRSGRYLPAFHRPPLGVVFVLPTLPPVTIYSTLRRFSVPSSSAHPGPLSFQIGAATALALFGDPVERLTVGTVARGVLGGRIRYLAPETIQARNVVAILPGSDPARRGEYVAMGAHNDHVGIGAFGIDHDSVRAYNILLARQHLDGPAAGNPGAQSPTIVVNVDSLRRLRPPRRDSIYNGADDDGAGTASLLAIAQALVKQHPARSILFISHTGEEQGLLGSRWYADHTTVPRDSIVAYLNMDLFGHEYNADSARSGPRYLQSGGARRLSKELGALIDSVNAGLAEPMAIDYSWDAPGHPSQKYCRSDHASYARYGIPVAYFSTGYGVDYHQVTDEPQYLDYAHMARAATLVYAVALRVADLDHRPLVDQSKPDPTAPCRQ